MRPAIYARVTTNNGQDPYADARTAGILPASRLEIEGEYVDVGVSGAKERRPQLDALLVVCRKRRVDAVVVYRYDRFARSLRQLVNALKSSVRSGSSSSACTRAWIPALRRSACFRYLCQHRGV